VLGIALAATGRLNPIWAAAAMAVGGLSVVGNSLRLTHYPLPREAPIAGDDRPTEVASSPAAAELTEVT